MTPGARGRGRAARVSLLKGASKGSWYSRRECSRILREVAAAPMKVRLLLGLQLLLLGALGVGGVTIAPLRKRVALGVLRKLVDLEKVDARQG